MEHCNEMELIERTQRVYIENNKMKVLKLKESFIFYTNIYVLLNKYKRRSEA